MFTGFFSFSSTLVIKPKCLTRGTPNGPTDSHTNPPLPPCWLPCPVNTSLQGFFFCSWAPATNHPPHAQHAHATTKRPNWWPWQPPTTPTPTLLTWKSLKSASMSRQHHRMVLSASSDVAGIWKHFSAAFSSAICLSMTPTPPHPPVHARGMESAKTCGWSKPPMCFLSFETPQQQRCTWNEQRWPQTPPHCKKPMKKCKNAAGVTKKCFSTSWQCWQWSGAIMHLISMASTSRESNGTPWKVPGL